MPSPQSPMPEHLASCQNALTDALTEDLASQIIDLHIDTPAGRRKLLGTMHAITATPIRCPACEDRVLRNSNRIVQAMQDGDLDDEQRATLVQLQERLARRQGAFGVLGVTLLT